MLLLLLQFCCVRKLLNELHRTKREREKGETEREREKGEKRVMCAETSKLFFPPSPYLAPTPQANVPPSEFRRVHSLSEKEREQVYKRRKHAENAYISMLQAQGGGVHGRGCRGAAEGQ